MPWGQVRVVTDAARFNNSSSSRVLSAILMFEGQVEEAMLLCDGVGGECNSGKRDSAYWCMHRVVVDRCGMWEYRRRGGWWIFFLLCRQLFFVKKMCFA